MAFTSGDYAAYSINDAILTIYLTNGERGSVTFYDLTGNDLQ